VSVPIAARSKPYLPRNLIRIHTGSHYATTWASSGKNRTRTVHPPSTRTCTATCKEITTTWTYNDADGNLTSDGRWTYSWDGENRLVQMIRDSDSPTGARQKLVFEYDHQGRRIRKQFFTYNNGWQEQTDTVFLYDGWNLIAELNANARNARVRTYLWGTDLSGTMQGAGGVGGLLKLTYYGTSTTNAFVAYDGNGNVTALIDAANGNACARYEYGPFAEPIRSSGPLSKLNPLRFSTKYTDNESGFLYYGYRYYNPSTGRWLSRDPIVQRAGSGDYCFANEDPLNGFDIAGLLRAGEDLFNVTFEPHHWYTKVAIRFTSGRAECGKRNCESPQFAQIALDLGGSLAHWLHPFGPSGEWFLDTDAANTPWYPHQHAFASGVADMVDAPGSRWYHPSDWVHSFYQFFETCAVCTDGGAGNYRVIGCVNWGHHIAGVGASSRWGDGTAILPMPPSSEFTRLFK